MTEPFREKVIRKCGESIEMKEKFFARYAESLEVMSREMADRFREGGRLFAMGNGGSLCDALHITVEFNHPDHREAKGLSGNSVDDRHRDNDRDRQRL